MTAEAVEARLRGFSPQVNLQRVFTALAAPGGKEMKRRGLCTTGSPRSLELCS
jgi:hypothetical protein